MEVDGAVEELLLDKGVVIGAVETSG